MASIVCHARKLNNFIFVVLERTPMNIWSEKSDLFSIFSEHESNVRSYCRNFHAIFSTAIGSHITDNTGRSYLDFLAGAGALNYGHNNPVILRPVIDYLCNNGIVHGLDFHTEAKARFIEVFQKLILLPRKMTYKMQFTGPTGANAVEAALKLARKVTGRQQVIAFSGGYHGMSLGALAATSNPEKRSGAGVRLDGVTFMPFDGFLLDDIDSMMIIQTMLMRKGSGIDKPAAILVECVQGEGGVNEASVTWLQKLGKLAREIGALLIVDDIQAGNGRTGRFFSFEEMDIKPDIVVLSKSLSGFGAPLSMVLLDPAIDQWTPGEHNGTFRGNNLAFVGATAAIEAYWQDGEFQKEIADRAKIVENSLTSIVEDLPDGFSRSKGRGLFKGLEFQDPCFASTLSSHLFEVGVIAETCGHDGQVLKLMPPLTISIADLQEAMSLLHTTISKEAQKVRAT
jgi:diaminobutyrate-2-oxoglutarate transaminase